jgi:hypothetical protein
MLVALVGDDVNSSLLRIAFEKKPSLIIDCGNAADPYRLNLPEEDLDSVYVIKAEAIYRFRDALRKAEGFLKGIGSKTLIVTTLETLFSYNNEEEDREVIGHCWEIIKEISSRNDVFVGPENKELADEIWDTQYRAKG